MKFLPLLLLALLSACETTPPPQEPQRVITFPPPAAVPESQGAGKWKAIPRDGGAEYAQVINHMEDVVSFYGFWADVAPQVKSFEDLEAMLSADSSFGFRSLQRGYISGVPVLWFEKTAVESGSGSPKVAALLGVNQRQPWLDYTVRTRGVFMFQPGPTPRFVTIACARTSRHGEIGSFYLGRFQSWLSDIVASSFL